MRRTGHIFPAWVIVFLVLSARSHAQNIPVSFQAFITAATAQKIYSRSIDIALHGITDGKKRPIAAQAPKKEKRHSLMFSNSCISDRVNKKIKPIQAI